MAVEPTRIEEEPNRRLDDELPDVQDRSPGRR
jgi:hypothetical protein